MTELSEFLTNILSANRNDDDDDDYDYDASLSE